jgi:hypothetical protein
MICENIKNMWIDTSVQVRLNSLKGDRFIDDHSTFLQNRDCYLHILHLGIGKFIECCQTICSSDKLYIRRS